MSSRYHGPLRWMSNFKAVQIDYAYYLTLSDEPQSVCLSERQMYILSVQNTYTYWGTRWYNIDDTSEAELRTIAAEIEELLMCGCGIPEPSITDRFNAQSYITTTGDTYETTYNTWNDAGQTVSSIAPNLDYGTGDPDNIDKLLCLALQMLVINIVEAAKANKQGTSQQNRDMVKNMGNVFGGLSVAAGAATGVGGAAAGFVAFLGGPYLVLGLALTAVGLAIANLVWTTDLSVFTDQEAINKVKCTMQNNIIGNTPTRAVFQGALTPNDIVPGSNAEKLAAVVQPYLDDLDTYLQWLATANGLYDVSDFGTLPECDYCPPTTWTKCWDLELDDGGFTIVLGTYAGGIGYEDAFQQTVNGYRGVVITRTLASDATITEVSYAFEMTPGTLDSTGDKTSYFAFDSVPYCDVTTPTVPTSPQEGDVVVTGNDIFLQLLAGVKSGIGDPGGSVTLKTLCLTGTGPEPTW